MSWKVELKLDSYFSFGTFLRGFKFPLLNSKGGECDFILFLNLYYITNYVCNIIPRTLGNAKTRRTESLLSGKLTTEGKKRIHTNV